MDCIFFEEDKFFLRSFLAEQSFARTDLEKLLAEDGFVAEICADEQIFLKKWNFDSIKILEDKSVAFEGKMPGEGKLVFEPLFRIFEDQKQTVDKENCNEKIIAGFKTMDEILKNAGFGENQNEDETKKLTIFPGAQGILVSEKQENGSFWAVVLPGNLFERCAENSKDYGKFQGIFVHRGLEGLEAAIFTRAALAYRAITKKYAFCQENLEKRQADITDSNFIPVEYEIPVVNEKLALSVDAGLCVKRKKRIIPGERRFVNEKTEKKRIEILKKAMEFNSKLLEDFFKSGFSQNQDDQKFLERRSEFIKKQAKKINFGRFYRRNSKKIWGSVLAVIAGFSVAFSFNKENQKLATSIGLTSEQTVQTLLTGIHKADVTIIQEIAKGKEAKSLIQQVSGFYVTNKQRLAMDEKDGTLTPAGWLFFRGKTDFWQYGITNLTVDGIQTSSNFDYPKRKDKKTPLKEENGKTLKKGDEISHEVSYNLIYNEGEPIITVLATTENVNLVWNGKRWIVRKISGTGKTFRNSYSVKNYKKDYLDCLEKTGKDVKKAAELLRQKYDFVPSEIDLKDEVPYMIKKYNSSAAKEFE
ncbi:hypothetical protein [Treponema berlinense]|uniref:hypothetical protein n=1 Tax=Treponema berlinense TaxID=225004 RepID=UPI003FD6C101